MNKPLISIIIPVYNVEKYILQCISSVLAQDYSNIEIIVVDDGSTDDSVQKLKTFNDTRLKIYSRENSGVSASRNFGIKKATGKYIYFLDSDDWIESSLIGSCVPLMESTNHDLLYFNYFIDTFSVNEELIKTETSQLHQFVDVDPSVLQVAGYTWNKFYRKSFLELHGLYFDEELSLYEDIDFNLKCFSKTDKILFLPSTLYHYNSRLVNSLVKSYNPQNTAYFNAVQKTISNFVTEKKYSLEQQKLLLSSYIMTSLRHQLNTIVKYSNLPFLARSKAIVSMFEQINNITILENYMPANAKEKLIKQLVLNKMAFILNIVLTFKK